VTDTNTRREI